MAVKIRKGVHSQFLGAANNFCKISLFLSDHPKPRYLVTEKYKMATRRFQKGCESMERGLLSSF